MTEPVVSPPANGVHTTGEQRICFVPPNDCPIDPEVALKSWVQGWGFPLLATTIGISVAVSVFLNSASAAELTEYKSITNAAILEQQKVTMQQMLDIQRGNIMLENLTKAQGLTPPPRVTVDGGR